MMVLRRPVLWWWWWCVVAVVAVRWGSACRLGGSITGRMECGMAGSPYTVTQDVEVLRGATLVLRPGVTVQFDPGVGITVRGTLDAQVRLMGGGGGGGSRQALGHLLECRNLNLPRPFFVYVLFVSLTCVEETRK